jgi:delta-aminolevulinic acid dehydratase/porphobilinogen synthase
MIAASREQSVKTAVSSLPGQVTSTLTTEATEITEKIQYGVSVCSVFPVVVGK